MEKESFIIKNRYEILTELGRGGMSTVYLARDMILGSYWAVKRMKNTASHELEAFKQEVELLAGLSHPDIPRIVDRVEDGSDYYVIMDFVDGMSLGKRILNEGPADEKTVIEWSKMLCSILSYLHNVHDNPIVYCDMKPDNIMLAQSGRVKLIDFGIAKECHHSIPYEGECVGTKGYASPEQYKSGSHILDERTDIYSLGCTMFYLLTGKVPGKSPNACPPLRSINPTLSDGIQYIVGKATKDDPELRYQSCDELLEDLEHISELSDEYKETMRRKTIVFISCLIVSLFFAAISVWGFFRIKSSDADMYMFLFNQAVSCERSGNMDDAAMYYAEAITYNPNDYNTYVLLFNASLPPENASNYHDTTKLAIDMMCSTYIDNESSAMYRDSRLMYIVAQKCIEVRELNYSIIADEYITYIKSDPLYLDGTYVFANLDQYQIIANAISNSRNTQDFVNFNQALTELENDTDNGQYSVEDKLQNYYILVLMYGTYPTDLINAYDKMQDIGLKAMALIDGNIDNEDFSFNGVINMYEMLALGNYNAGLTSSNERIVQYYNQSLEWFNQLDRLHAVIDKELRIKRAICEERLFLYYTSGVNTGETTEEALQYIYNAIEEYEDILSDSEDYFLCRVKLAIAYVELANATASVSDYSRAETYYWETRNIYEAMSSDSLTSTETYQFGLLTDAVERYGIVG